MNRTGWLSSLLVVLAGLGVAVQRWPATPPPELPCRADAVRVDAQGVARCEGEGALPSTEARLSLGGRLDLNRADEAALAKLPGVGRSVARALIEEREARGPFLDWFEVEAVPGVGPTRLRALQASAEIH